MKRLDLIISVRELDAVLEALEAVDVLDELDDVDSVHANFDIPDSVLQELAG